MRTTAIITFLLLSLALRAQDFEWAKSISGSSAERSLSITSDASGNLYVVGYFDGTVDFDPGAGITNLTSTGSSDAFIQKLDSDGNFIWAKSFGGTNSDYGYSMCFDNSGNILMIGYFESAVDFDPGAGTTTLTSAGYNDVFVLKLNTSGSLLWVKSFGGPDGESAYSISKDNLGNIYIAGAFGGNASDFDPGPGITTLSANGFADVFIEKLDPDGNFLWVKAFGGTGMDVPTTIKTDGSGNSYTCG